MSKRDKSDPPAGGNTGAPAAEFPRVVLRSIGKDVAKGGYGVLDMEVPCRWEPGSVLSWDDALFINYALAYYAGSNFVNRMKKLQEEGKTEAEIRAVFADYVAKYEWSPRGAFDPVESEARKIARERLSASLGGGKLSDYEDDIVENAIAKLLEEDPSILAGARAIVDARNAAKASAAPVDLARLGL